jgi:hypothetical protein
MAGSSKPKLVDQKYIDYWRQQSANQAEKQKQAVDQAWQEVRQMARCLRQEFGAQRILGRVLKASQSLILSYEKSRVSIGFKTDPSVWLPGERKFYPRLGY